MSGIIESLRDMFDESERKRIAAFDLKWKQRTDIVSYDNILYGEDPKWHIMDIYRPANRQGEKLPVIISVHGGGWIHGYKEGYQYYCMELASHGYAVVNFTYRLAPQFYYPAPIEDLNTLMQWLLDYGSTYGMNLEQLYGVGDSAGAHTLGTYATICSNEAYAKWFAFRIPKQNPFQGILLNSGVFYRSYGEEGKNMVSVLVDEYLQLDGSESDTHAIEMFEYGNFVNEDFPPTFLMTAQEDFVKMHSVGFATVLAEKNIDFTLRMYASKTSKLEHIFNYDFTLKEAAIGNADELHFLKTLQERN